VISVAGISHATAPLEVRERFAISSKALPAVLRDLHAREGAAVLLSTCNRTELYVSHPDERFDAGRLGPIFVGLVAGEPVPAKVIYTLHGREAARHLLRVASGLDSMVLGEDQILGQVRGAFIAAVEAQSTDRLLSRLFHLAIATGRRVRTETALGRYARSVSMAAVETIRQRLGDLSNATVLVISAGEAGKLTAKSLSSCGTGRLLITSRTRDRARTLAEVVGGTLIDAEEIESALAEADVVISASAAPGYQITARMLRAARSGVPPKPLLAVDIAVPRDIDPALADEPGVTLLDIDHLQTASAGGEGARAVTAAEAIVAEEVARLAAWWETLRVVPTITALRERAESIRRAELQRSFGRLPDLTPEQKARIEAMTAAMINKLLHHPIRVLKQPEAGEQYASIVHELFDLPSFTAPEAE
jgi:glutamyl-tRNA reductase